VVPEGEEVHFVHDHAPIHDAIIVHEFFEELPLIVESDWPLKFVDCNPIENLFGHTVLEWQNEAERNVADLEAHVLDVWEGLRHRP